MQSPRLHPCFPEKPNCHKCAPQMANDHHPDNSPNILPHIYLRAIAATLRCTIYRQSPLTEIPFLRAKIPFSSPPIARIPPNYRAPAQGLVSASQRQASELLRKATQLLPLVTVAAEGIVRVDRQSAEAIELSTGGRVISLPAAAATAQGYTGHVVIDEAAWIPDAAPREAGSHADRWTALALALQAIDAEPPCKIEVLLGPRLKTAGMREW